MKKRMPVNILGNLKLVPADEIFRLASEYNRDKRTKKINGGIGVYLDDSGKFYVHKSVRSAIKFLNFFNFNYLPISGDPDFLAESLKLLIGSELSESYGDFFARQGVIGGTDGLYIWGNLIKKIVKKPKIIIGTPTWENHKKIFNFLGFEIIDYDHLDQNGDLNLKSLTAVIRKNPRVYILLQAGPTHNPTGVNLKANEWKKLAGLIGDTQGQVLFDFAYMGMGDNVIKDSYPVRLFIERNIPTTINLSFSKNMTLYQHRVGALFVKASSKYEKEIIESHLQAIFRIVNSNPAAFGEFIVKTVLQSRELRQMWFSEISEMSKSLKIRRQLFADLAGEKFKKVTLQKGLFSLLHLHPDMISKLKKDHAIYLLSNSRVNFGGISKVNIPNLAASIKKVEKDER